MFVGTRTGILDYLGTTKMFAQLWGTPNIDGTDPFCASAKSVAYELTQGSVGSGNSYTPADIGSAQMYIYIGDNQAETRPVYFGMVNGWRLANGLEVRVRHIPGASGVVITTGYRSGFLEDAPGRDILQVQRLKKRKLYLRDRIAFIEDQITPDIIA